MGILSVLSSGNSSVLEVSKNSSQCKPYFDDRKAYIAGALAATLEITSLGCVQCGDFSTRYPVALEVRTDSISMPNLANATSEALKSAGGVVMVEFAKTAFFLVEKVCDVQIIDLREREFECRVFVDMPKYNDDLMDLLISKEIDVDSQARRLGCCLKYCYLPIQFV